MTKKKNGKQEKAATPQREKLNFTEAQLIAAVKSVDHPASSREISDKLGIKDPDQGRAYVRSRMQALANDKKIALKEPTEKSRCSFLYTVAE